MKSSLNFSAPPIQSPGQVSTDDQKLTEKPTRKRQQRHIECDSGLPLLRSLKEINPGLELALQYACSDIGCYGEVYTPDFKAVSSSLRFHASCVPDGHSLQRTPKIHHLISTADDQTYPIGVGLPGLGRMKETVEEHDLKQLANDPYFPSGGDHLEVAADLFDCAISISLYFHPKNPNSKHQRRFLGVIILYQNRGTLRHHFLRAYLATIQECVGSISRMMAQRSVFTSQRRRRNRRAIFVAILFTCRLVGAYTKKSGKVLSSAPEVRRIHQPRRKESVMAMHSKAYFKKSNDFARDLPVEPNITDWIRNYIAKANGGIVQMPKRMPFSEALATFFGVFLTIGVLSLLFELFSSFQVLGNTDMFILTGSFGALCTILFALPAAPLAQPCIVFLSHTLAMTVAITIWFAMEDRIIWFQRGIVVATTITLMSLLRIPHPPAGALSLIFTTLLTQEKDFLKSRLLMLVISVAIGLVYSVFMSILVNNLLPVRSYPSFW
eukprot:jgi/Bigna1/73469/fgenesh1_pg.24_\